jgi:hypothetical protein
MHVTCLVLMLCMLTSAVEFLLSSILTERRISRLAVYAPTRAQSRACSIQSFHEQSMQEGSLLICIGRLGLLASTCFSV